ncbi:MAG TPA: S-methyl-5-thioribose-1-phosphate isomerase [Candidatus Binataceae bacterium]|jgi:methylthioribose-1-phosphate isomerase|nr:S-methyl-5-thioribose-1-phosphate isomerase [Candidatus Binataceae bacterium]
MAVKTIEWRNDTVRMIDQRLLPTREVIRTCRNWRQVADAIRTMVIRGAPAIGVAAAMGLALGMRGYSGERARKRLAQVAKGLRATRPTAVNLAWAVERMGRVAEENLALDAPALFRRLREEALRIYEQDLEANRALGRFGARLLDDPAIVLTHCNAGALATAGYGTALGVIRAAREAGKHVAVIADETRPFLQGSRLTAWELRKDRIPVTIIADNMAASVLARGGVSCVIVGTDRTAANGDVANKIGTYPLAVMARRHGVPFYVAAPLSSIDLDCPSGAEIPIEERSPAEITHVGGKLVAPKGVSVFNPAFDVTPAELVSAIITERGVAYPPYGESLAALKRQP